MLICDTHADTLHGLQDASRDAAKPFDVTAAHLTSGPADDVRVQALALWTGVGLVALIGLIVVLKLL